MDVTSRDRSDGFGAQYQEIICAIVYAEMNGRIFHYNPIKNIEHNYDQDPGFLNKISDLMNLQNGYPAINENCQKLDMRTNYDYFENNIDFCLKSDSFNKIKRLFHENKEKDFFKNGKINIAVHVRRPNLNDCRSEGTDTPDTYYLNIINHIRKKYTGKDILFHIYSQGDLQPYISEDTILHKDEDMFTTFKGLVAADVLVTSASSFSYVAALLNNREIYYKPFWHKPSINWIQSV